MEDRLTGENRSVYSGATGQAQAANGAGDRQTQGGEEANRYAAWKEGLTNAGQALADRAKNTARITNDYAHEEPWKLVGIGAAIGVVLGMLIAARR